MVSFARSGATTFYLHTPGDVVDFLGPEPLAVQGRFIEIFLQRYVAGARTLPFERKVPEEQQKKIREYFQKRLRIDCYAGEKKEQPIEVLTDLSVSGMLSVHLTVH